MQQIKVRLIKKEDYKSVREIDELTQFQYQGEKWKKLDDKEKDKNLVSRVSDFEVYLKSGFSLVALCENNLVGFLFAYKNSPFNNSVYVNHIAINPKLQGQGVGTLIYRKLISIAKAKKIKRIDALVNFDNPQSIELHRKIGFVLEDRKEAIFSLN